MARKRLALLVLLAALVVAFFALHLGRFLDLGGLKRHQTEATSWLRARGATGRGRAPVSPPRPSEPPRGP